MIPETHRTEIIQNGLAFMRSITEAYGTDEGMKLWETIADSVDPDIKAKIFFAMLTGEYINFITITGYAQGQKVPAIKAIRTVTGLGLKEAKDICDSLEYGNKTYRLQIADYSKRSEYIGILRNGGVYL